MYAFPFKSVHRIWPVGRTSMFPIYEDLFLAGAGPGTADRLNPSHSKNFAPFLKMPGLVSTSTFPLGSNAAGPSAMSRPEGKSGPDVQMPVRESKIAVCPEALGPPLAPVANTVPSGLRTAGPSSAEALLALG